MPNVLPNLDGKVATETLNTYMTDQIIPNCNTIFAGGNIPENLITETRERFQDVNKLISEILADLP
jgi:hypothetical protein